MAAEELLHLLDSCFTRCGSARAGCEPTPSDFLVWTPVPLLFGGLSPRRDPHHHRHRRTDRTGHQPHPRTRSRWHSGGRLRHRDGAGHPAAPNSRPPPTVQQGDRGGRPRRRAAAHPHPRLLRQVPGRRPHPAGQRCRGGAFTAAFLNFVFHPLGVRRGDAADGDITQIGTTSTTTPWRHRSKTRPGGAGSRSRRATAHRTPVGWPHARNRTRTDDRLHHTNLDRLCRSSGAVFQRWPAPSRAMRSLPP